MERKGRGGANALFLLRCIHLLLPLDIKAPGSEAFGPLSWVSSVQMADGGTCQLP